jgi:hypothetical protein
MSPVMLPYDDGCAETQWLMHRVTVLSRPLPKPISTVVVEQQTHQSALQDELDLLLGGPIASSSTQYALPRKDGAVQMASAIFAGMSLKSAYVASLASYVKPELPVPAKRARSETPPQISEEKDQSASSSRPQPSKKTRTQVSFNSWGLLSKINLSFSGFIRRYGTGTDQTR